MIQRLYLLLLNTILMYANKIDWLIIARVQYFHPEFESTCMVGRISSDVPET